MANGWQLDWWCSVVWLCRRACSGCGGQLSCWLLLLQAWGWCGHKKPRPLTAPAWRLSNPSLPTLPSAHPPTHPPCFTLQGLSSEEMAEIQRGLQPLLKQGQKLTLEEVVDPTIIGGVILSLGDKYVDMSILARVRKLQQIVRDAV